MLEAGQIKFMLKNFRPDRKISTITDINLEELKQNQLIGLIIDIDNTIMPYGEQDIPENIKKWLETADAMNFRIYFLSNTMQDRANYVEETLGYPACSHSLKPRKKCFYQAQKYFGLAEEEIVVIGDQIFTDIFGGNRAGFNTILVEPLNNKDFILTKFFRMLENFFR